MTGLTTAQLSGLFGVLAGAAAIVGFIAIVDALTTSYKEAAKASDDAAQAFEDSTNKVNGIKKELQDVNDKIDEINKQDKISPTDDANLQKLKTQKELLERDLAIEQKLYKLRQKQNAEKAADAIAKGGSDSIDWRHQTDNDLSRFGVTDADRKSAGWEYDPRPGASRWEYDLTQETAAMQSAYNRYVQQQNELKQQLADNGSLTKEQEKQKKQIDEYTQKLEEAIGQNVEELQTYRERLTNSAGQALKGREDQVFQIDQVLDQYGGIERDPFTDIAEHWKELQRLGKTNDGLNTSEMRHYLEVITGKDFSTAPLKEIKQEWSSLQKQKLGDIKLPELFTGDSKENLQSFWKMVQGINSDWAKFDEKTQTWKFNIDSVEELAQKLGLSEDLVRNIVQLTNEAGANIELHNYDNLGKEIIDVNKAISQLKQSNSLGDGFKVDVNVQNAEDAQKQLDEIGKRLETLKGKDGKLVLDDKDAQAAYSIVTELYNKYYELSNADSIFLKIDTSGLEQSKDAGDRAIDAMNKVVEAQKTLAEAKFKKAQGFEVDVEAAEKSAQDAVAKMRAALSDPELQAKLGKSTSEILGSLEIDASKMSVKNIDALAEQLNSISADNLEVALKPKTNVLEQYLEEVQHTTVELKPDSKPLDDELAKSRSTKVDIESSGQGTFFDELSKTHDVYVSVHEAAGSWKPGTSTKKPSRPKKDGGALQYQGNAHAGGKWGTTRNEVALTSELGPEIVVDPKTGRWQTVGDKGAQFTRLPKGAIVFNHKQTEQLLKYGHINSRGKALVGGNAYPTGVQGTWNVSGNADGSKEQKDAAKETTRTAKAVAKNVKDSTDASKSAADKLKEETSNLTDWVEKVLENIDKKTEKYLAKAEKKAEAGNYSGAARQYQKALNTYDKSIGKHGDAENLYMQQANKALSKAIADGTISKETAATIQKRVANGAMDISKLSDGTKAVVDAYKEYYDKAVAAADATMELYDKYEETAKKMYQLPLDQASSKTDKLKDSYELLEKKLDLTNSTTQQAAIIEKQMENVRKQHAAATRAAATAENNFIKAQQEAGRSLDGLSDALKEQIQEQLAKGLQIDITSLTGLTADGKQAILDYNSALAAQTDAMNAVRLSALETNAALLELAANKANKPNEKADATVAKLETNDELLDAQIDASTSVDETLELLDQKRTNSIKRQKARKNAVDTLLDAMYEAAEDHIVSEVLDAQGKEVGQKINLKDSGYDPKSKEYKALADYNALTEAYDTALINYQTTVSKEAIARNDIALASIQAAGKTYDYSIQNKERHRDDVQAGLDNLDTYLNKIKADPNNADILAHEFYEKYGWRIDPKKGYAENQKIGYDELATTNNDIASLYGMNVDAMQTQFEKVKNYILDGQEAEKLIAEMRDAGAKAEQDANDARKNSETAATTSAQTERRNLEREYAAEQNKIATDKASGKFISNDDYNRVLQILTGWVDAEGVAHQGLIDMLTAEREALKKQRETLVEGTPAWEENERRIDEINSQLTEFAGAVSEAKDAITANDVKGIEDALAVNGHNANMIAADQRKKDALGSAISGALGSMGMGDLGAAVGAVIEMVGGVVLGGVALGDAFSKAVNDPEGFSLSGLLGAFGENMSSLYTTQTTMGNLQEAHGIYDEEYAYYQQKLQDPNISDAEKEEYTKKSREIEEARANNEADQAEEMNKNKGGGGGGGGGEDWAQKAWQMIQDMLQRYYVKQLHVLSVIEGHINDIKRNIKRAELEGRDASSDDYVQLAKEQKAYNHQLQEKVIPAARSLYYHQLSNKEDKTGEAAEAAWQKWKQHQEELKDAELEILSIIRQGLRDSILQPLSHIHEYQEYAMDAMNSIGGLISDKMRFTKDNKLSEWGQYQSEMLVGQFKNAQEQIQAYYHDIEVINAEAYAGLYTGDEASEKIEEIQKEIVNLMGDEEAAAQSLADMMQELGEKELDSLHDIIDARKEALQSKKDYYEYDKNIRKQSKDIQSLEAQIAALEGLTDAESKAKRARLEEQLAEAQEQLEDTIHEHEMTLADESLDKLAETLDDAFEEQWDEITTDLHKLLEYAQNIADKTDNKIIAEHMQTILKEFGVQYDEFGHDLSQFGITMRKAVEDSTDGLVDSQTLDKTYNDLIAALKILQQNGLINDDLNIDALGDKIAVALGTAQRVADHETTNNINTDTAPQTYRETWRHAVLSDYDLGIKMKDDLSGEERLQNAFGEFSDAKLKPWAHILMTNFLTDLVFSLASLPFNFVGAFVPSVSRWWDKTLYGGLMNSLNNGVLSSWRTTQDELQYSKPVGSDEEPKKSLLEGLFSRISSLFKGKSSGSRRISKSGMYWTQEGGKEEWIVRPSDGAILTPLSKGNGVLPADITSKLWALAEGHLPQMEMPKMQLPDFNIVENYSPNINIDSSIHVAGSVDAAVISDLKKFRDDMCEDAYKYTSEKMFRGYMHSGGKRRV